MSGAEKPPDSPVTAGPTKHYEGLVEKKGPKEKEYEKQWIILMDNRMVVYNQRITQRELSMSKPLESVLIDKNWNILVDNKEKTKLVVKCKAGTYKFKMSAPDERDNWWIRFHAISKMTLPKIHLLPGQTIALQEIIDSMRDIVSESPATSPVVKSPQTKSFVKQKSAEKPNDQDVQNKKYHFYPDHIIQDFRDDFPIPPTWYFEVSRVEAEELLLNNPEHGAIIIRNSESHSGGFSLSMRQDPPLNNPQARPIVKHFRFSWNNAVGSFQMVIEEQQPQMKTMYDLLAFFIEKHGGNIRPMHTRDLKTPQHPYELGLRVSTKDPENGEAHQPQDTYLQPQRAAPEPPSKARPDRQSLPASFNTMIPDLPQGAEAMDPRNRVNLASAESPPNLPPPRQRCVSTCDASGARPLPDPYSSNLRRSAIPEKAELSEIFEKFGISKSK